MSFDTLSERQRQVVLCVGQAMSTKQIARKLGLSPRTVELHVGEAYAKLGVRSRVALALLVYGIRIDADGQA